MDFTSIILGVICGILAMLFWRSHVKFDKTIKGKYYGDWTYHERFQHDIRFIPQLAFAIAAVILILLGILILLIDASILPLS